MHKYRMNTTREHEYNASEHDGWGAGYDRADDLHAVDARKTNSPHSEDSVIPAARNRSRHFHRPAHLGLDTADGDFAVPRETRTTAATDTLKRVTKRAAGPCRDPARDEAQSRRRAPQGPHRGRVPHGPALPQGPAADASTPSSLQLATTSAAVALAGRAFADRRTLTLAHGGSDRLHRLNARIL
jgi:hypothetical protein